MTEEGSGYSVLLASAAALQPPAIAKVLGTFRKIPFQDAIRLARNCWGIVDRGLEEDRARTLQKGLQAAGIECFVLGPGLPAGLPESRPARRLALGQALDLGAEAGGPISWDRLVLIAAAGFEAKEQRTVKLTEGPSAGQRAMNMGVLMATGLPIKIGKQEREVEKTVESTELVFFLDLVAQDPPRRLRVDAQRFDFSCLGSAMKHNILDNFRLLVGALAEKATGAWQNRGTTVLLERKPIREMGYRSLEDLERESRWLLTLIRRAKP